MSERVFVSGFMKHGGVTTLCNKLSQESVELINDSIQNLDKVLGIRGDQKSVTDGEVAAIRTYGTIEQMKQNFANKLQENADCDNIHLTDQKAKLYCMMNENKELPLKNLPKIDIVKMGMVKAGKEL